MTDENNMPNNVADSVPDDAPIDEVPNPPADIPDDYTPAPPTPPEDPVAAIDERINRLSGEPAPDISPEDFARLQRLGSLHIDSHGRVRVNRREETDAGVSLKKRRAWYAGQ